MLNPAEILHQIAARFPDANPNVVEFPSGAVMLDITLSEERYCVEYLPSYKVFGLSKIEGATPFWEGFDESFDSAGELSARIDELTKGKP